VRLHVAVMTYRALSQFRADMLRECADSLFSAFPSASITLFDNDSRDGSDEVVAEIASALSLQSVTLKAEDDNTTPGAGRNRIMAHLLGGIDGVWEDDVIVFSDDDMKWKLGAGEKIKSFWSEPPENVMVCSGFLEPDWHWNKPERRVVGGDGVAALVRASAPGAGWTFKVSDWSRIGPVAWDFGYDYTASKALAEKGLSVAQFDLADHLGWDASTHGNRAIESARPLDREKWGI
jgi:hypothetical protein